MLTAIQVQPGDKRSPMAPASRINFGKMYTVEYNVKVCDFGDVRRTYIPYLVNQWKWVIDCDQKGNNTAHTAADTSTDAHGSDDDGDETDVTQLATVREDAETSNEAEVTVLGYGTAIYPWTAQGQLTMEANDRITVTYLDENWGQGINFRTRERGSFPRNYVRIDGSDQ
jgi:hypothetical protein